MCSRNSVWVKARPTRVRSKTTKLTRFERNSSRDRAPQVTALHLRAHPRRSLPRLIFPTFPSQATDEGYSGQKAGAGSRGTQEPGSAEQSRGTRGCEGSSEACPTSTDCYCSTARRSRTTEAAQDCASAQARSRDQAAGNPGHRFEASNWNGGGQGTCRRCCAAPCCDGSASTECRG